MTALMLSGVTALMLTGDFVVERIPTRATVARYRRPTEARGYV
ncbi:MAG: hypothetical protein M5U19_12795 [Microthrixaceae bacterium]|nr:hypothetical protein [Microthrixaceae bacterium]